MKIVAILDVDEEKFYNENGKYDIKEDGTFLNEFIGYLVVPDNEDEKIIISKDDFYESINIPIRLRDDPYISLQRRIEKRLSEFSEERKQRKHMYCKWLDESRKQQRHLIALKNQTIHEIAQRAKGRYIDNVLRIKPNPCPKCGNENIPYVMTKDGEHTVYQHRCGKCGFMVKNGEFSSEGIGYREAQDRATSAWNNFAIGLWWD